MKMAQNRVDSNIVGIALTRWVIFYHAFLVGLEYSCIYVSLLYYLQELHVYNAAMYFCVLMSCTSTGSLFMSTLTKQFGKLTSNIKWFLVVLALISFVGNLLYTSHSSVWFLVVGRLLCGFVDSSTDVIQGTFGKLYANEQSRLMDFASKYELFYTCGFLTGPLFVASLWKYKTHLGNWSIDRYNGVAFIMAWFFLLDALLMMCCGQNLNNLVVEQEEDNKVDQAFEEDNKELTQKTNLERYLRLKKGSTENLMKNDDVITDRQPHWLILLIFAHSLLINFICNTSEMLVVILSVQRIKLPPINFYFLVVSCLFIFMFGVTKVWRKFFNDVTKRVAPMLLCVAISILSNVLLIVISSTTFGGYHFKTFCMFLVILLNSLTAFTISPATQNLIAVLFHNDQQRFEQDVKRWLMIYRVFGICGLVLAGFIVHHLWVIYVCFIGIQILFSMTILLNKSQLSSESN
ncbi:uncharacterized protein [Clytia hemisphaerica]|uniref:Uncharacterized protein n=1 Tax=Clytia hemisphaerica TaxID=252671 RepID=A0A7M5X7T9_9CNID|eukprot:TCONS_00020034-protein